MAARPPLFRVPGFAADSSGPACGDRAYRLEKFSDSSVSAWGARAPRSHALGREPRAELGLGGRGESAERPQQRGKP